MQIIGYIFFILTFTFSSVVAAETIHGQWHLGIGDNTFFGWLTVALYFIATFLAYKKYVSVKKMVGHHQPLFWIFLAVFLLFLGINKQLDLQTWFTQIMKERAIEGGWYADRRMLQGVFISFLGVGMVAALLTLRVFLVKSWHLYKIAWFGVILLCTFVCIRAASFHHFDILIGTKIMGLNINVIMEIGAILLITWGVFNNGSDKQMIKENVLPDFVEVKTANDGVQCPNCHYPALSEIVDGRRFKCKKCKYKYTVYIR